MESTKKVSFHFIQLTKINEAVCLEIENTFGRRDRRTNEKRIDFNEEKKKLITFFKLSFLAMNLILPMHGLVRYFFSNCKRVL